jgi:putative ABC transport system substrate-binding protein
VFAIGGDPVRTRLVSKLSGSGGNVTGVTLFNTALMPKRLELIREVVPTARVFAMLVNSQNPGFEIEKKDINEAASASGVQIFLVHAAGDRGPQIAFAEIVRKRVDALLVSADAAVYSQLNEIIALAAQHRVLAIYFASAAPKLGGLITYAPDMDEVLHQAGIYVGRILKGEKPGNLPIQQPIKFKLVINLAARSAPL